VTTLRLVAHSFLYQKRVPMHPLNSKLLASQAFSQLSI
jgi:hypothetical protein